MREGTGDGPPFGFGIRHAEKILVIFRKRVAQLTERALAMFVGRAARAAGVSGEVHVLLTNNREMRSLNGRFRGKHGPTDVLSFPAEPTVSNGFAGDVAISAEFAASNARLLGHSPAEEVKILALHGVLHLAGYDHEKDQGEMAQRERQLRRKLRLPVTLIERSRSLSRPHEKSATVMRSKPRSGR